MTHKFYYIGYKGNNSIIFKESIKKIGSWANYMTDQYLVRTHLNATELQSTLEKVIVTGTDVLFIVEIDAKAVAGWLPSTVWTWIKEQKVKQPFAP